MHAHTQPPPMLDPVHPAQMFPKHSSSPPFPPLPRPTPQPLPHPGPFLSPSLSSLTTRTSSPPATSPLSCGASLHTPLIPYLAHQPSLASPHTCLLPQGIIAVGGDGIFQEIVKGLVALRAAGAAAATVATGAGPVSAAAAAASAAPAAVAAAAATRGLRLGHIPGGSTDAAAFSMHNTRSAEAAALHIALGDRLRLDVGRLTCGDGGHRPFVCQVWKHLCVGGGTRPHRAGRPAAAGRGPADVRRWWAPPICVPGVETLVWGGAPVHIALGDRLRLDVCWLTCDDGGHSWQSIHGGDEAEAVKDSGRRGGVDVWRNVS
eukprot:69346-Chlamydomonas_euryale.AAC.3